jgi:hypothetical protein
LFVEISRRGYRTNEPNPIRPETSQILNKVFTGLRREGVGKTDIARELHVHPQDLDALVFGLAMLPVAGGSTGQATSTPTAQPRLRLV